MPPATVHRKCMNTFNGTINYKTEGGEGGHAGTRLVEAFVARRKAAVSIPNCVSGILHLHDPSGRTMALGCRLSL